MLLATNTGNVMREFAPNAAVDLFHDAGFSALDFSFFDEKWFLILIKFFHCGLT